MPLIEWKKEYAVGVPAVDTDHRELIDLINDLYEQLQSGRYSVNMNDFLGEVYDSMARHFAREEEVMNMNEYPQYEEHKADHERVLEDINNIMYDYQDGLLKDDAIMAEMLEGWFSNHFANHDLLLHVRIPTEPMKDLWSKL